jgi:hypothetical protein
MKGITISNGRANIQIPVKNQKEVGIVLLTLGIVLLITAK